MPYLLCKVPLSYSGMTKVHENFLLDECAISSPSAVFMIYAIQRNVFLFCLFGGCYFGMINMDITKQTLGILVEIVVTGLQYCE